LTPVQRLQSLWSYRPRLVRFALGMGACSFVAEDIASEALVRAAFARTLAVEVGNPLPYLVAVAGNLMRDEFRRAAHDAALSRRTQVVPRQRDLENEVVDRDYAVRALRRLRDSEPATTVEMLVWLVEADLTWAELAREFDLTTSAVQSRVWRALARLRARLRDDRDGWS
jgi:RNA polymerase sigma factor (sigma-70 family)